MGALLQSLGRTIIAGVVVLIALSAIAGGLRWIRRGWRSSCAGCTSFPV
jgi:hypothetical protein